VHLLYFSIFSERLTTLLQRFFMPYMSTEIPANHTLQSHRNIATES